MKNAASDARLVGRIPPASRGAAMVRSAAFPPRRRAGGSVRQRSSGLALIAVLWMVAALSLVAASIMTSTRTEIRTVAQRQQLFAASQLGDAAIAIVLRDLVAASTPDPRWRSVTASFDGHDMTVRITPLSGLVDINRAPASLLADLFAVAGGVDPAFAGELAARVVERRRERSAEGGAGGLFAGAEELLQLPGFDYGLYARISDLITVSSGFGRINPLAAPPEVLRVLARGDEAVVARFLEQRDSARTDSPFPAEHVGGDAPRRWRLEAIVRLADVAAVRTRHVMPVQGEEAPWRSFSVHTGFVANVGPY